MYGHPEHEGKPKKNVGVLQLLNKCNQSPITDNDKVRAFLLIMFIEKVFGLPGPDRDGSGQHCGDIHIAECHSGYQAGPRHAAEVSPRDLRG